MEGNHINQIGNEAQQYSGQLGQFIAMLSDEVFNGIPGPTEVQQNEVIFNDDMYQMLAFSPATSEQSEPLPKIAMEMLDDFIGNTQMMVEMMSPGPAQVPTNPEGFAPMQDLETQFGYPQPELHQMVPVKDPSVMLSNAVPRPTTIDQSVLMENSYPQTVSETPSESMSVDQSQTPSEVSVRSGTPDVGGGKEEEGEPMTENTNSGEPPKLPEGNDLLIRIRYRSEEVTRATVTNQNGCLVYYHRPWDFKVTPERLPKEIMFPNPLKYQNTMTDSQYRFTEQVIKAIEKGLLLQCDEYGNVYATRFCRSKIFWYSTEKGPIAEAQRLPQVSNLIFQKLERNKPVMVFDNMLFQRKLLHYVVHKPTFKTGAGNLENKHSIPISPAIFFTFAQSWNPLNSPLNSCLVSMVVNPLRARMQRQWGNEDRHESYDLSNYHPQISSQFEASGHS